MSQKKSARPAAREALVLARRTRHLTGLVATVSAIKAIIIVSTGNGAWLGADGENYLGMVDSLRAQGFFAEGLMYWPAGYPLLLWALSLPGAAAMLWLLSVVQTALWSVAVWLMATAVLRTRVAAAALPFAYLALLNPTLSLSSIAVGYESPAAALHLIAAAVLLRDLLDRGQNIPWRASATAGSALGLAVFMQPRLIVGAVALVVAWFIARAPRREALIGFGLALTILVTFPVALMARNQVANGVATISTNLGATMMIGAGDGASGTYTNSPATIPCDVDAPSEIEADNQRVRCVLAWYAKNPAESFRLAIVKSRHFWSPWFGPIAAGTMARNPWLTIHPIKSIADDGQAVTLIFGNAGVFVSLLWVGGSVLLLALGTRALWRLRDPERWLGTVSAGIVLASWAISVASIGDHRFRLPVLGLSLLLQAVGFLSLVRSQSIPSIAWLGTPGTRRRR